MVELLSALAVIGVGWLLYRSMKKAGFGKDHSTLHKEATQHKKEGDWDKAIQKLKAARNIAYGSETIYPIRKHLRLPLYLQQAGRMDEAVQEFRKMLRGEYPSKPDDEGTVWIQRGVIYDKMRLAYQREGMYDEATVCGAFGFLCDSYGVSQDKNRHDYEEEMERIQSKETARSVAEKNGKRSNYDIDALGEIIYESVHMLRSNRPQQVQEHMAERIDALE